MRIALLDACVLYPPSLRDLLMWLAAEAAYAPRFTDQIHDEWTRSVLEDDSTATPERLARTRRLMNQVHPDALVTGYEHRIPGLALPDPDDRHVLAAAIEAHAPLLVTFNRKDFPESALAPHGVTALRPDPFFAALFDENPDRFLAAVRRHRAALRHPPKTPEQYLATLRAHRLNQLADRLEPHAADL